MSELNLDIYLTPAEVASVFGITPQAVHKICKEQDIETRKKGERKHKIYPENFAKLVKLRGFNYSKKRIAVHSVKGGVGKTTLVHALASRASAYGFKTLIIDLDKQANLTNSFGLYPEPGVGSTLFEIYNEWKNKNKHTASSAICKLTDYLHLIPATLTLANFDVALQLDTVDFKSLISQLLANVQDKYDLIFFDLPPDFNRVTSITHSYADLAIIPVNMDRFSLKGVEMTYEHLDYLQKMFHHTVQRKIVVNKFDARHSLAFEIMSILRSEFMEDLCEHVIPVSKSVENSLANDMCVWDENVSKSTALEGFENVLKSILDLQQWQEKKAAPSKTKSKSRSNEATAN